MLGPAAAVILALAPTMGCGGGSAKPSAGGDAGLPACDGQCTVSFASGSAWTAFDDDIARTDNALELGPAQPVCLNATSPPDCPPGAVIYGVAGQGWMLSRVTIPGAVWIWGPDVTGADPADLQRFFFTRTFVVGAAPSGHISIAADDAAEVRVNGVVVNSVGSITDITLASAANSALTTLDLTPRLIPGENTMTIAAQNGPASYAGCPASCTYSSNPAGVVFGGSITYH